MIPDCSRQDQERPDQRMTLADGRQLGYAQYGNPEGTPLLLFHGTPGARMLQRPEKNSWAETRGIRLITPERPGYGLSDPAPGRTIVDWASDVEQLADHLGLDTFHVAGGSGGGPYALACAARIRERVRSATLIASGSPVECLRLTRDMVFGNRMIFFFARHAPFVLKRLFAATARTVNKRPEKIKPALRRKFSAADRRNLDHRRIEKIMGMLQEGYRQGAEGPYRDMLLINRPWGFALEELSVPVFLWHGIDDNMVPVAAARALAERIPHCEAHFLPGMGHMLLADEDVAAQMMDRMLSVDAPPPP